METSAYSRARSTLGQENEAGHCTKKSIPGVLGWAFWGPIRSFTKVSYPCWKYICSRAVAHMRQTRLAQANYMFQCTRQNEKKGDM